VLKKKKNWFRGAGYGIRKNGVMSAVLLGFPSLFLTGVMEIGKRSDKTREEVQGLYRAFLSDGYDITLNLTLHPIVLVGNATE
jgi:hypothetical protein